MPLFRAVKRLRNPQDGFAIVPAGVEFSAELDGYMARRIADGDCVAVVPAPEPGETEPAAETAKRKGG